MPTDKQTKVNQANQSLLNSVRKLDKINDIDIKLQGTIEEIIEDPVKWAEAQIEQFILEHQTQYLDAKQLGRDMWDEIRD
jgi:hypothetical protein